MVAAIVEVQRDRLPLPNDAPAVTERLDALRAMGTMAQEKRSEANRHVVLETMASVAGSVMNRIVRPRPVCADSLVVIYRWTDLHFRDAVVNELHEPECG